jgi:hypothetical protein
MKIHPVGGELSHVDGQTGRHDEVNNTNFLNFVNMPKNVTRTHNFLRVLAQQFPTKLQRAMI